MFSGSERTYQAPWPMASEDVVLPPLTPLPAASALGPWEIPALNGIYVGFLWDFYGIYMISMGRMSIPLQLMMIEW